MIIAVVPARSGSKGFPNKNIAKINGVSLIELAVNVGLKSKLISDVFISTDSKEYEDIGVDSGAKSLGLRPSFLATDTSKTIDVVIDMLKAPAMSNVSHVVLLQTTSPIRNGEMIDCCINKAIETSSSVVTVSKIEDPHPAKIKKICDGHLVSYLDDGNSELPRQQLPEAYELTGSVYVSSVKNTLEEKSFFSKNTVPYLCDEFVNIDNKRDFDFLQFLISNKLVTLDS